MAARALIILTVCALPARAQEARLEAEVDRYSLSTDDVLYYSVTVHLNGNSDAEPELEDGQDFALVGTPQQQDGYDITNGRVTHTLQRVYALQPRRSGELTVPRARIVVGGREYTTRPIRVRVTRGGAGSAGAPGAPTPGPQPAAPAPGPDGGAPFKGTPKFVIICRANKKDVYVNEQLIVDLDYYTTYRFPRPVGEEAPKAEGFIAERLPDPTAEYVTINGEQYARITCRWALFPTTPGRHKIASAPENLMFPPLYTSERFQSNAVQVNVRPLPTPPPGSEFSGAVGSFTIQLSSDKTQVKAGEGLTVRVVVDGIGNTRAVRAPKLPAPDWCKVYQSGEQRSQEPRRVGDGYLIGGKAEFDYLLVPRRAGRLEIPCLTLDYFRPDTGRYERASSSALVVDVAPGEVLQELTAGAEEAAIRHIHTRHPRIVARGQLLFSPLFHGLVALCLLAVLAAGVVRVRTDRRLADPVRARARGAARAAYRGLARAQLATGSEFYGLLGGVLSRYLADRFNLPATGLVGVELQEELSRRGVSTDVARRAAELIATCHACRFAPGAQPVSAPEALARARALIAEIERGGAPNA